MAGATSRMPIEDAYCGLPDQRLRACPACLVTWFGTDEACWVCGVVPGAKAETPAGAQ